MLRDLARLNQKPAQHVLAVFLLLWVIINTVQATFMELHADEAYYWVYARFLDWGYFDHPPMVAISIRFGDSFLTNSLGLRLATIITTTLSVFLLWLMVKKYARNAVLFILLFLSFLLFHVFGFITTPDSPLLLFSILFFYAYARYAEHDDYKWALCLSVIIALLLYSKYHGVLILLFTIISNFKLLKRPSFWLIVFLAILLYLPHIWWQISHDYPSVHYHLFDRSAKPYKVNFTLDFILGQLLLAGPLVGWFLYWSAAKVSAQDDLLLKALKVNFYGVFLFFLLSTIKGHIEAHWTLLAFPPAFILSYVHLAQRRDVPKWFMRLAVANLVLIMIARVILMVPIPFLKDLKPLRGYFYSDEWAGQIKERAGDAYVVFNQGFQEPSKYNFYNREVKALGYTSRYYRRNQFDFWPIEASLRKSDSVYFVIPVMHGKGISQDSFPTSKGMYYGRWIEDIRIYQKVAVAVEPVAREWGIGEERQLSLQIHNPYQEQIDFSNRDAKWKCFLEYVLMENGEIVKTATLENQLEGVVIAAGGSKNIEVKVKAPRRTGKFKMFFSIRTEPFPGNRNSRMVNVAVL